MTLPITRPNHKVQSPPRPREALVDELEVDRRNARGVRRVCRHLPLLEHVVRPARQIHFRHLTGGDLVAVVATSGRHEAHECQDTGVSFHFITPVIHPRAASSAGRSFVRLLLHVIRPERDVHRASIRHELATGESEHCVVEFFYFCARSRAPTYRTRESD